MPLIQSGGSSSFQGSGKMRHAILVGVLLGGALGVTACSGSVPVQGGADPASASSSGGPRWTANIRTVYQDRFNAPDSVSDKSYGSAQWTRGDAPAQSVVNLVFTYAGAERDLSWAILFGNCGTASLPVIPRSSFPELDVSGGGAARASATIAVELPALGAYHINIYRNRHGGAESVVGCGDLKLR